MAYARRSGSRVPESIVLPCHKVAALDAGELGKRARPRLPAADHRCSQPGRAKSAGHREGPRAWMFDRGAADESGTSSHKYRVAVKFHVNRAGLCGERTKYRHQILPVAAFRGSHRQPMKLLK